MAATTQPFGHSNPCDLCGRHDYQRISERDRRGQDLPTDVCRTCGLISHAVIPTEEDLTTYYASQYRLNYHGEYSPAPHRVIREWNRGRRLSRLLTPFIDRTDRITEIGCGIGATVKQLERAGFHAEGIDPGVGFCQFGAKRLGAQIRTGTLAGSLGSTAYDVVLLVHVLEHLRSPTTSLAQVHSLLRPGGRLYIEVPNAGAPHAAPGRMFHQAHIYNFTWDTLGMLVDKSGFRVRQWLCSPQDRNLQLLVERSNNNNWQMDPSAHGRTLSALTRYNGISYYLRWRYLKERLGSLLSYQSDHIMASTRLRSILRKCSSPAPQASKVWGVERIDAETCKL